MLFIVLKFQLNRSTYQQEPAVLEGGIFSCDTLYKKDKLQQK